VPGNPIAAIAKQTRSRVHNLTKDCSLYLSDGRPVSERLDAAMEEEWNDMLDTCKQSAKPEPHPDASLGSMLRELMRQRRHNWEELEAQLAQLSAGDAMESNGSEPRTFAGWEPGLVKESEHQCEGCAKCFEAVDKLDRHRLLCLEDFEKVCVRSSRAFSGYEGVVQSHTNGKWEVYIMSDRGYGRKRRRIGDLFDTAQAAAKEYAIACRKMLLEVAAERDACERDSIEDTDADTRSADDECRIVGGPHAQPPQSESRSNDTLASEDQLESGNCRGSSSEGKSSSSETSPAADRDAPDHTDPVSSRTASAAGQRCSPTLESGDGTTGVSGAASAAHGGEKGTSVSEHGGRADSVAPAVNELNCGPSPMEPKLPLPLQLQNSRPTAMGDLPAGAAHAPDYPSARSEEATTDTCSDKRRFSFKCTKCTKTIMVTFTAAELENVPEPHCACQHCGATLRISPPAAPAAPPLADPARTKQKYRISCVGCHSTLQFLVEETREPLRVRTTCPKCHKALMMTIPGTASREAAPPQEHVADSEQRHELMTSTLPAWALDVRSVALKEEEMEDTDATLPAAEALVHWHWANLEYANGSQLFCLSNRWWDADDAYDFGGAHSLLPEGYGDLLSKVATGLTVRLGHVVRKVSHIESGVAVHYTEGRSSSESVLNADVVIVSVPLGVLKARALAFDPPLPQRKQQAIDRLGFGVLNKVLLGFEYPFWKQREGRRDFWGIAPRTSRRRGQAFQFWNMTRCTGRPLLLVLHAGRSAALPGEDAHAEATAVAATMEALRAIFGAHAVPEPISKQVTRWEHDPFSLGVYSHVAVGASARDYDVMAEPLWCERLLWAGEATSREHPATVAGAFLSGIREAGRIACRMHREALQPMQQPATAPNKTAPPSATPPMALGTAAVPGTSTVSTAAAAPMPSASSAMAGAGARMPAPLQHPMPCASAHMLPMMTTNARAPIPLPRRTVCPSPEMAVQVPHPTPASSVSSTCPSVVHPGMMNAFAMSRGTGQVPHPTPAPSVAPAFPSIVHPGMMNAIEMPRGTGQVPHPTPAPSVSPAFPSVVHPGMMDAFEMPRSTGQVPHPTPAPSFSPAFPSVVHPSTMNAFEMSRNRVGQFHIG